MNDLKTLSVSDLCHLMEGILKELVRRKINKPLESFYYSNFKITFEEEE